MKFKYRRSKILFILLFYLSILLLTNFLPGLFPPAITESQVKEVDSHLSNLVLGNNLNKDEVLLLEDPYESYLARASILKNAEESIIFSYYYSIGSDDSTRSLLALLLDAANRGVEVKILIDGVITNVQSGSYFFNALSTHENIEVRAYNNFSLFTPWTLNNRMHDKYIIVDDTYLLTGGRNHTDSYLSLDPDLDTFYIDRDILFKRTSTHSIIDDVNNYFNLVWNHQRTSSVGSYSKIRTGRYLSELYSLIENPIVDNDIMRDYIHNVTFFETDGVYVVSNPFGKLANEPVVKYAMNELFSLAKDNILINTMIFTPHDTLKTSLRNASDRGVEVTLVTNSLATSLNIPGMSSYYPIRKELVNLGMNIYEQQMTRSFHLKSLTIDDTYSVVGSYNFDPRSDYLNTEMMFIIKSPSFTHHLNQYIYSYQDQSLKVLPNSEYEPNSDVPKLQVPLWKRILFVPMAIVEPLIRHLI